MNPKHWQDQEGHPPAALLLLHLESELDAGDAETVRGHLVECERCRATCKQLERGMSHFAEFRTTVDIPTPAPRTSQLLDRFRQLHQPATTAGALAAVRNFLFGTSHRRLVFAMGTAACVIVVGLVFFLGNPRQSVYASQILNDARNASESLIGQSKVLNQKFRLRRGNVVIERTAHHAKAASTRPHQVPADPQLQKALDLAHIRLDDPLSVNDFSDWRSEQSGHSDSVKQTSQGFIITVHVNGSEVTEGSLTLSRSELRPIARSVEFRDETPIEITEESYSISDAIPEESATGNATLSSPPPASANRADAIPEPSVLDLERAELELREALHTTGADVSASPVIWRADHRVFYHAIPKSQLQRDAIERAASELQYVKEAERAPTSSAGREPSEEQPPHMTAPPLGNALARSLGSEQAVSRFLDSVRTRSVRLEGEVNALNELGVRYSPETIKALPVDLRKRVNALASSLLSTLQHDTADYEKFLTPVLDDVSQGVNVQKGSANIDNLPGCLTWQQSAALAAPQIHNLQRDVLLMFTPQESGSPGSPDGEELLSDATRIRLFLEAHLISTCELF